MTFDLGNEDGLGVVELLVALAITSLLAMALGWFLSMAINLRSLSERTTSIDRVFVRLIGFSANLGHATAHANVGGAKSQVEMVYEAPGRSSYNVTIELRDADRDQGRMVLAYGVDLPEAIVDLSSFDAAELEVYAQSENKWDWRAATTVDSQSQVKGVRLHLEAASRHWYSILWVQPRALGGDDEAH